MAGQIRGAKSGNSGGHPLRGDDLSYQQALGLLSEYLPPGEEAYEHCLCVSQVAERIALAVEEKVALDLEFVRTSALLHDIGRALTHDGTFHCWEGYF